MKDKTNLGYLGEDFQYKLIHTFFDDKEFFKELYSILNQNMFTNPTLRVIVGVMKEYYEKLEAVPSYSMMGIALNEKAHNDIERETYLATLNKIQETASDGVDYIRELSKKFFKQQNIIRTANEILKIAGNGDTDKYDKCVELLNEALTQGAKEDYGVSIFDDLGETLSNDYRTPIPTGIGKLDESLEGGLGKGELGVIIGPTSFGKALSMDSLLLTPKGFIFNKDIKLNDYVIGNDGKPTKVVGIFPQGKRQLYKVTFIDDSYVICDSEHLWNIKTETDLDYITLPLKKIMDFNLIIDNKYQYYIPICDTVEFIEQDTLLSPYDYAYSFDFSKDYIDIKSYIFNSKNKRSLFLRGLLDKYGEVTNDGLINIVYKDITLENLNYIKQLIYSFGGYIVKCDKNKITFIIKDKSVKLFSHINKQNLVDFTLINKFKRYIKSITIDKIDDAQCIKVDNNDELYLTNDFIVTHNTSLTTAMASYAATYKCPQNENKGFKVLQIVFEDKLKQIQRKHIGRLTGVEAKDLSKDSNVEFVRETLENLDNKELLANNIRIKRFPTGEKTASDIYRFIKKMINNGFKPDLVIIDYFECLSHDCFSSVNNDYDKEGKTMRKLESMASELDIALWVPSQGTKESINLELVTMDKMGGSVKKSQIAHVIMSIARTVEDIESNKATIALLKNRAGKSGKVFNNVEFNNGTCRISTDNVDEFDNMLEYNKNSQKEFNDLAKKIFKASQERKNKNI